MVSSPRSFHQGAFKPIKQMSKPSMTSKSSSSSGHRFHGVKKKAPTPAGRGMSSVATGRYRNRKAAMKGTRFHAILAKVLSRTLKASDVNTAEKKTMEIKALGMRTWAEAHPGWKYYGSEIPIRVGKSASLVDAAYQSWDGKEVYLVDAKYGGKGIFTSGANKSAKRKGEDEHEHEAHRQQVAGYCLSWNEERKRASEATTAPTTSDTGKKKRASKKSKVNKKAMHNPPVSERPPAVRGFLYYVNARGPEEVRPEAWERYLPQIRKRWGQTK